jgi:integrase
LEGKKHKAAKKPRAVVIDGITYYPVDLPAGYDGNSKRQKRYCKTQSEVADVKARIRHWKLARKFKADTLTVDDDAKRWIAYLQAHIGDLTQLPAIVAHWNKTAKSVTAPSTVKELCDQFIYYRKGRPHSKRTLSDMRYRTSRFAENFGSLQAHEISATHIRKFLDSAESPASSRNHYKVLSVLFKFAKERRIIAINPLDEIKRPDVGHTEPGIYQPDEFRRLLETADNDFPELLPFVAVSGFAGLRAAELIAMYTGEETLQWSDVLWDKRLIHVRPEVAKTTKRKSGDRRYIPMEPALIDWLTPHRKESGTVAPYAESWFRKLLRGHKQEPEEGDAPSSFGLFRLANVQTVDNGLRHSFASYWLARSGKEGFGSLARIMGNSEAIVRKHYVEILTPDTGENWFGIRRGT